MDYEKKYKEALERAKKLYEQGTITESLGHIFPELKESEDEKIRKAILNYFIKCWGNCKGDVYGMHVEDVIAWLEKQGEQKPTWSEEDNMMIEETLYFLREYQQSNRCKDESGMQNSVSCEKWLKSLKERLS